MQVCREAQHLPLGRAEGTTRGEVVLKSRGTTEVLLETTGFEAGWVLLGTKMLPVQLRCRKRSETENNVRR